jgi:hypothetical protein
MAVAAAATLALATRGAYAQGGYEIEVYSTELTAVRALMLELHSNYTLRGRDPVTGASSAPVIDDAWVPARGNVLDEASPCAPPPLFQRGSAAAARSNQARAAAESGCPVVIGSGAYATHESLETVTGINSWSEAGAYLFTSEQSDPIVRVVGASARYKVVAPGAWRWPVGAGLSTELEYDDPRFSSDEWSWEIRPVVDKALGRWYLSANPTLERTLAGTGVANGVEFSPSAKVSFDVTGRVTGGVEYYGAYGKVGDAAPAASRLQQFFAVVDLRTSAAWEVNAGIGAGTTPASSHLVAKLIVGRRFAWN